ETGALTDGLGGEKRLEDPIADLVGNSRARVLDVHRDAAARRVGAGAKREPAWRRSLAQLITGVGDQIDHDLVELVRIGPQDRQAFFQIELHLYAVDAQGVGKQVGGIACDVV